MPARKLLSRLQIFWMIMGTLLKNRALLFIFSFALQHGMEVYVSKAHLLLFHSIHDHHTPKKSDSASVP